MEKPTLRGSVGSLTLEGTLSLHDLEPLASLELKVTADRYKIAPSHQLHVMMKHSKRRALFQHDKAHINEA